MSRLKHYIKDTLINESINDKGILKACFMTGLPASGKSYTISKISSGSIEPRIVNTDKITEFLKAFKMEDWLYVDEKIKQTTKNQLSLYLNSMLPLWVDGTSANPSSLLRRVGILKSVGYDVSMLFIDVSLETSLERSKKRYEKGGRETSEEFIRNVYKKLEGLKSYYASEFNDFTEILNDDGELIDKVILQAYKKMSSFFSSPLKNPIGIRLIEDMKKNGHKYLVDTDGYSMNYIKKLVSTWYRS